MRFVFIFICYSAIEQAAVILSASVTFLSLPGLDDISRLAGLIAILFSASSMISTVVALFRYKADVERTVMYVGGEGLMVVSVRFSPLPFARTYADNPNLFIHREEALSCLYLSYSSLGR